MNVDFESIVDRVQSFDAQNRPAEIAPSTPEERARGNVERIGQVLLEGEGFGAYFVVGDPQHESQHAEMCALLGIENVFVDTTYPIIVEGVSGKLERTLEIHDSAVTGVWYNVTSSAF